jgi:hypothetical protein
MTKSIRILFALVPLSLAACGGGSSDAACTPTGTQQAQFVVNSFSVPKSKTDYAVDLNGDGEADNQLGQILGFLASSGLDPQKGVDDAMNMGELTILIQEKSTDPAFQTDSCAGVSLMLGTSSSMTAPTPNATYTVSSSTAPTNYSGQLKAGAFTSQSQIKVKDPLTIALSLPFLPGTDPLALTLTGAEVSFTRDASGNLTGGTLNGVVKESDLKNTLIPGFATILTQKVQRMLGQASTNMQILMLFDNGGGEPDPACPTADGKGACKNPDGSCAVPKDGKIDPCEVSTSFIQFVLVPDVQMYNGDTWAPSADNTKPDSLSVGIGLAAVPAKF